MQLEEIPPTLLVSAVSVIGDGRQTTTSDFKAPGSLVYVVGESFEELGGSEFFRIHQGLGQQVPKVDARRGRRIMKAVGARTPQIAGLYLTTVLVFALLALDPPRVLLLIALVYAASGPLQHFWRRARRR